jgi:hypothetical protein
MYLAIIRKGIEFDAERAFRNLPTLRDNQTEWDVLDETFHHFFQKFMKMTEDFNTPEVMGERRNLLWNLQKIAIHNVDMTTSVREHLADLANRILDTHIDKLISDPENTPTM